MRSIISILLVTLSFSLGAQEKQARFDDLNSESTGRYDSYLASDGAVYKVGDRITLATTDVDCAANFSFVRSSATERYLLPAVYKGSHMRITKIRVEGMERTGYYVTVYADGVEFISPCEVELERAISSGEIECFGMTAGKALAELRKAKEKLDLQLITQQEYDAVKATLAPYIR